MCLVVLTEQVLRTARVEEGAACSPLIGPTSLSLDTLSLSIGSSISLGAYPQPSASTSAPTSASAWISPAFKRATCLFFGASVLASEAASASGRSPQPSASTSAINLSVSVSPPKATFTARITSRAVHPPTHSLGRGTCLWSTPIFTSSMIADVFRYLKEDHLQAFMPLRHGLGSRYKKPTFSSEL